MPRTSSRQSRPTAKWLPSEEKPAARSSSSSSKKKKQPSAKKKPKIVSHTDDGIPVVNATSAQIRKGISGKTYGHLVQIPQVAERSRLYVEAAEVIGERESLALPYHGGRMWRCEITVSDEDGACGDNCNDGDDKNDKNAINNKNKKDDKNNKDDNPPKKKRTNYKSLTPLFRWYRGGLVLATLPYTLEEIVEVECKMPGKKRWANGLSDDELDSSDEEWDDDRYHVEPATKMTMEMSALTASARGDTAHPMPRVSRTWISPDLRRFASRGSAVAHAGALVERDLLIDRTLYGYGHGGARLRPAKPSRKVALEAGMARFLRDGLWVVGQEEMWIEKRRDVLVRKQERKAMQEQVDHTQEGEEEEEEEEDEGSEEGSEEGSSSVSENNVQGDKSAAKSEEEEEEEEEESTAATDDKKGDWSEDAKAADRAAANYARPELDAPDAVDRRMANIRAASRAAADLASPEPDESVRRTAARAAAGYSHPELDAPDADPGPPDSELDAPDADPGSPDGSEPPDAAPALRDRDAKIVSPAESDASAEAKADDGPPAAAKNAVAKRAYRARPPPAFTPSTHYRLTDAQVERCYDACVDHYERVMHTVRARYLYQELADGFDVLRERGRGRFDMELGAFDAEAFSFLTDPAKAAWMPVVRKILGGDASLVHKGCFLSLPGSETQVYHQDGVHLNKKTHKPCYAINVFIPLVDYDMTNGPTEFCLGTHYLGHENFVKSCTYTPCVTAGTPVIFDYRLGHRGLRNHSAGVRPVVYLTYSSMAGGKEFRDSVNFSKKRYCKLGDFAEKPLSREERARKRCRQEK